MFARRDCISRRSGVFSFVGGYSRGVFSESEHVELLRAPNRLLKSGEAIIEDMLLISSFILRSIHSSTVYTKTLESAFAVWAVDPYHS